MVPYIAIASPLLCYGLNSLSTNLLHYPLGYELLMINGLITFAGMWMISKKKQNFSEVLKVGKVVTR
jgi:hypothetical protein